jgi:hypothetical protein
MFVSRRFGICFVHNPRSGGQSVRTMIGRVIGVAPDDDRFKIKSEKLAISVHSPACRIRKHKRVRERWDDLYRFGVIRNPWERAVSIWAMGMSWRSDGACRMALGLRDRDMSKVEMRDAAEECRARGFAYWLTEFCPKHRWAPWRDIAPDGDPGIMAVPQLDWFTEDGRDLVRIFRLGDTDAIERALSRALRTKVSMPHVHAVSHRPYTEYYDARARDFIGDVFAPDIRRFGYRFGA